LNRLYLENKAFSRATFFKVDEKLDLVFGGAIISKINGEDYIDLQGDIIPEDAMLEAAVDFIAFVKSRVRHLTQSVTKNRAPAGPPC
jgi:hypothetical protein